MLKKIKCSIIPISHSLFPCQKPVSACSPDFFMIYCLLILSRYIKRGKPDAGFALFESESLKWPGFVEFDDVNGKVLTYSAQDR